MNKIEAVTNPERITPNYFDGATRAFLRVRTERRVLSTTLDTAEAYLASRLDAAYDRLMCQLADIESLQVRYETMAPADQEARLVECSGLIEAHAATLRSIDQAIALAHRVNTHLMGTLDFEYVDEDMVKGEAMSVGAVECFQSVDGYALSSATDRHNARREEFLDRDEANWSEAPEVGMEYSDEEYAALAAEDAMYEAVEA